MKVLLIFPPVSPQFHMPYLSVPALGAFLKQEEPGWGVMMRDMNIELAQRVLSPKGIAQFKKAFSKAAKEMPQPGDRDWASARLKELVKIERFLRVYPGDWRKEFYSGDQRRTWYISNELKEIENWLITVLLSSVGVEYISQQATLEWADKFPQGIMTDYFREEVVPEVKTFGPDLIGYSWIDHGQVLPSLVLDKILRESGVKARTVVGGPYVSLVWERLKGSPVTERFDHFVYRQGEEPLLRLGRSVAKGESPDAVGKFMEPINPDVHALPPPDFGDYPLDKYYGREKKLCLLGSWGCYWGECSFCNVRRLEGIRFKPRKPEQIANDMAVVKQKFNPDIVRLSDNAISFSTMVKLSEILIEKQVGLPWITNTRFDGKWTREGADKMARANCAQLMFGLESAADEVMNLVHKGTDLDLVREILGILEPTGIWCHFYMIVGYPTETREDWIRTVDFFKGISKSFPKLKFSTHLAGFGLQIQSPMYHNPKAYHIAEITEPDPKGWSTLCAYKLEQGYTNLLLEPGVYEEMKKLLEDVYIGHLSGKITLKGRFKNRMFIMREKLKLYTGI